MSEQDNNVNWLLFLVSIFIGAVGIFQLGYIIGAASFSSSFSFEQVGIPQIGLICSGICGVSVFAINLKKLVKVSKSTLSSEELK